jgi:hypothetical protein
VTPAPGPNVRTLAPLPIVALGGDNDGILDNCETARLTVRVENNGATTLTNVRAISAVSPTHPLTVPATPLPATIAATLLPCASASIPLDVIPHGMSFNQTFQVTVTITADQIAPQTRAVTFTVAAPNCSRTAASGLKVRTTFPFAASEKRPAAVNATRLTFGGTAKLALLPAHGSAATSIGFSRSTPFGTPLRYRSNQRVDRSTTCSMSAPGNCDGWWPKSPTYSRFGPPSCKNDDFALAFYSAYKQVAYEVWAAVRAKKPAPQPSYQAARLTRVTIGVTPVRGSKNVLTDLVLKRGGKVVAPVDRSVSDGTGRFTFDYSAWAPTTTVRLDMAGKTRTIACVISPAVLKQFR